MKILDWLLGRNVAAAEPERGTSYPISIDQWMSMFSFAGHSYQLGLNQTLRGDTEEISGDFVGLVRGAYKSDGIVFAAELARMSLFSEATFKFQRFNRGRPGVLWGDQRLRPLEQPWPGVSTRALLKRMLLHADLAGSAYVAKRGARQNAKLRLLRPDWVTTILGSESDPDADGWDVDAEILGYLYHPGGRNSGRDPVAFLANEVAQFSPIPDPEAMYRGMSWLTPVVLEILGDKAATRHKIQFFENGATPNLAVKLDIDDPEKFRAWQELFAEKYEGVENAYKTLFMGAGADYTVIGSNFQQIDFKATQGAGETRIAAASGVGPVILGLSEGLQGSSLNAGNYGAARRRFADGTMRPLWGDLCSALAPLIDVPNDSRLWYDDRDVSFLQEDVKDAAEIVGIHAQAIRTLTDGGYEPQSVIDYVDTGDKTRLKHTGLLPVQVHPPGTAAPSPASDSPAESDDAA